MVYRNECVAEFLQSRTCALFPVRSEAVFLSFFFLVVWKHFGHLLPAQDQVEILDVVTAGI